MIKQRKYKYIYARNIPTVFVVSSPFQLLCAKNAILSFGINDFHFVFVLFPQVKRNEQMFAMAEDMQLQYDLVYTNEIEYNAFFDSVGLFSEKRGNYKRAFLGSFFRPDFRMVASLYIENGEIAFLDDGTSTLSLFEDGYFSSDHPKPSDLFHKIKWYKNVWIREKKLDYKIKKQLLKKQDVISNGFFTIYDDVATNKFLVYPNRLSLLSEKYEYKSSNQVFIVGPFIQREAEWNGLEEGTLLNILTNKLKEVRTKFNGLEIIYIPHGSDISCDIVDICNSLSIKYQKLDAAIEYWFLQKLCKPYSIYGFGSTALLNLKKMFPDVQTTDWFIDKPQDNPYYSFYSEIAEYYDKNGIVIDKILWE